MTGGDLPFSDAGHGPFIHNFTIVNNTDSEMSVLHSFQSYRPKQPNRCQSYDLAPHTTQTVARINRLSPDFDFLVSFYNPDTDIGEIWPTSECTATNFTLPFKLEIGTHYTFTLEGTADICSVRLD